MILLGVAENDEPTMFLDGERMKYFGSVVSLFGAYVGCPMCRC